MYGTDLSGPVSVDNEEGVVVQEVPNVLSEEEISLLKQQFVQPDMVKEEIMLQNYMVAKSFVHSATATDDE